VRSLHPGRRGERPGSGPLESTRYL
jgi:hypothetical protein